MKPTYEELIKQLEQRGKDYEGMMDAYTKTDFLLKEEKVITKSLLATIERMNDTSRFMELRIKDQK